MIERVDRYLQLVRELDLKLVKAVDTHLHADHVTGLGALRDRTHCITVMGEQSHADVVSMRVTEGDQISIEGLSLDVLYTPGHTDDSYSFLLADRVFTGDTLLIRGTGRTDFQNGDPRAQYNSIFNKLMKLPDSTLVYPAHDYKGETVSTIGEEKFFNPRLKVKSVDEYVDLMNSLNLPNPKMMDVAVPANMHVGLRQADIASRGWALTAAEAIALCGRTGVVMVDLREQSERAKARGHSRLAARRLSRPRGQRPRRRHAARAGGSDRQARGVLLRLRRALGDGGAGGAGSRHKLGLPYRGRHRRVEKRERAARAMMAGLSTARRTQRPSPKKAPEMRKPRAHVPRLPLSASTEAGLGGAIQRMRNVVARGRRPARRRCRNPAPHR